MARKATAIVAGRATRRAALIKRREVEIDRAMAQKVELFNLIVRKKLERRVRSVAG